MAGPRRLTQRVQAAHAAALAEQLQQVDALRAQGQRRESHNAELQQVRPSLSRLILFSFFFFFWSPSSFLFPLDAAVVVEVAAALTGARAAAAGGATSGRGGLAGGARRGAGRARRTGAGAAGGHG